MRVEITQKDMFLDIYLQQRGKDLTISQWRDLCDNHLGFWPNRQIDTWVKEAKEARIRRYLEKAPRYDEAGNPIGRAPVERRSADGKKQQPLWIETPRMNYRDKVKTIESHLKIGKHHFHKAQELYCEYRDASPARERNKLERRFQGLLELDFANVEMLATPVDA